MKLPKPLSFLPMILVMCLIFSFSAQTAEDSSQVSITFTLSVLEWIRDFFHIDWQSADLIRYAGLLEHFMRKLAHFTEYLLLAVSAAFPFHVYRIRGRRLILLTVLFCAVFAGFDEWHQSFIPGRAAAFRDVCIDTAGSFCGVLLFRLFLRTRNYFAVMIRHS